MNATKCPTREVLLAYHTGELQECSADEVIAHLSQCHNCQATVSAFGAAEDSLIAGLRRPPAHELYTDEPECRELIERAKGMVEGTQSIVTPEAGTSISKKQMPPTELFRGSPSSAAAVPGQLREYRILEKLGQGGMGAVYKALHTRLDKLVALKVLPAESVQDAELVARFDREMKAVGKLEHPNIVRAMDAGCHEGTRFLVMEFIDGMDLGGIVKRCGQLRIADACEVIRQAALGLRHADEHALVHRDIKPSNLVLNADGVVKILDLGLALLQADRLAGDDPDGFKLQAASHDATGSGRAMGTLDYMAPEQVRDSHSVDIRADIYSLGCTLYKLLAGQAPFTGTQYENTFDKMMAHLNDPFPPIGKARPDVPEKLAAVLQRMVAKDRDSRYAKPSQVIEDLKPFCPGSDLAGLLVRGRKGAKGDARGAGLPTPPKKPTARSPESPAGHEQKSGAGRPAGQAEGGVRRPTPSAQPAPSGQRSTPGSQKVPVEAGFDPYYKWLSIPPEEQPPNYYRLLGTRLFEGDRDVIQNAASGRSAHLRTFALGKHSLLSQRMLSEIEVAKVCLLTPEDKIAYDARLRQELAAKGALELSEPSSPALSSRRSGRRRPNWLAWAHEYKLLLVGLGLAGALGLAVVLGIIATLRTKDGTLVVEVDQRGAKVEVLDAEGKIVVSGSGDEKLVFTVPPGKHKVQVEKDGFKAYGEEIEMETRGRMTIRARLEKAAVAMESSRQTILASSSTVPYGGLATGKWISLFSPPIMLANWASSSKAYPATSVAACSCKDGELYLAAKAQSLAHLGYRIQARDVIFRATVERELEAGVDLWVRSSPQGGLTVSYHDLPKTPVFTEANVDTRFVLGANLDEGYIPLSIHQFLKPSVKRFELAIAAVGNVLFGFLDTQPVLQVYHSGNAEAGDFTIVVGNGGTGAPRGVRFLNLEYQTLDDSSAKQLSELRAMRLPPEEEAARWTLDIGVGNLTLSTPKGEVRVDAGSTLPKESFAIVGAFFRYPHEHHFPKLRQMKSLRSLDLSCLPSVSDARLLQLAQLSSLTELNLSTAKVTAAGVAKLQAALPKCKITVRPEVQKDLDALAKSFGSQAATTTIPKMPSIGSDGNWKLPADAPPPTLAPFDAAKAGEHQKAWAQYLGVPVEMTNSIGMKFVLIPPGEFIMGSPESEGEIGKYERPQHRVRITKAFYLAACEVTQKEYGPVIGTNPSFFTKAKHWLWTAGDPQDTSQFPVETVSWQDAVDFCKRLGDKEGKEYRLPTEGEWEYACRAGTTTRYYSGEAEAGLGECAWYRGNSGTPAPVGQKTQRAGGASEVAPGSRTYAVGEKTPNAWGLYDMLGNVKEWCTDWYARDEFHKRVLVDDPTGPALGKERVVRGGSWAAIAQYERAACRQATVPDKPGKTIGFRVACEIAGQPAAHSGAGEPIGSAPSAPKAPYDGLAVGKWISMFPDPDRLIGWNTRGFQHRFANGELCVTAGPEEIAVLSLDRSVHQAMILRCKVKLESCKSICLTVGDAGTIFDQRAVSVGRNFDGRWGELYFRSTTKDLPKDRFVEVAFAAIGPSLIAYVDGEKVAEVHDSALRSSKGLGFNVHGGIAYFRDAEYQVLDGVDAPNIRQLAVATMSPDREAAQWVLGAHRGFTRISKDGGETEVKQLSILPEEPYTLVGIFLSLGGPVGQLPDGALVKLTRLTSLRVLDLSGRTTITDKGLPHLMQLKSLRELNVSGTRISTLGLAKFRAALPECKIIANSMVQDDAKSPDPAAESRRRSLERSPDGSEPFYRRVHSISWNGKASTPRYVGLRQVKESRIGTVTHRADSIGFHRDGRIAYSPGLASGEPVGVRSWETGEPLIEFKYRREDAPKRFYPFPPTLFAFDRNGPCYCTRLNCLPNLIYCLRGAKPVKIEQLCQAGAARAIQVPPFDPEGLYLTGGAAEIKRYPITSKGERLQPEEWFSIVGKVWLHYSLVISPNEVLVTVMFRTHETERSFRPAFRTLHFDATSGNYWVLPWEDAGPMALSWDENRMIRLDQSGTLKEFRLLPATPDAASSPTADPPEAKRRT